MSPSDAILIKAANNFAQSYVQAGIQDPSAVATGGEMGSFFIQVSQNGVGPVGLWQKQDDGLTTNWTPVGGSAPAGTILANGTVPFAANESMAGFKLTNLGTPTAATDAANKSYVDAKVAFKNAQQIYVDATDGSDVTGTGAILNPYQSLNAAVAAVVSGTITTINLAPGNYTGADIALPPDVSLAGSGGVDSISVVNNISYTAPAGEHNFIMSQISFQNPFIVDLSLASVGLCLFDNCEVSITRLAGGPPSASVQLYSCIIRGCEVNATVIMFSGLFTDGGGVNNVRSGGELLCNGCVIGPGIDVYGTGTLALNGSILAAAGAAGHTIGPDTPTLLTDSSSLAFGGAVTGFNISYSDDASREAYFPGDLANWPILPLTVQDGLDILASEAITSSPQTEFVFQPGGTVSKGIYTDFGALYTDLQLTLIPRTIYFDDSFVSPAVIPSSSYNFTDVNFDNYKQGQTTQVRVSVGTTWQGLTNISNLSVEFLTTSFVESVTVSREISLINTTITSNGTGPIWELPVGAFFRLLISTLTGPASSIDIAAGQTLLLIVAQTSSIVANAITGDGTTTLTNLIVDITGGFTTQTGFTGTVNQIPLADAQFVPYEPGTPGDWGITPPSQVADALNILAAEAGGSGANTFLSNLTSPTAINQDLLPGTTNVTNLGSGTEGFFEAFVNRAVISQFSTTQTGSITIGTPTLTVVSAAGLFIDMAVYGPGMPPGTAIDNISGTTITLNGNATATEAAQTYVFVASIVGKSIDRVAGAPTGDALYRSGNVVDGISGSLFLESGFASGIGKSGIAKFRTGNTVSVISGEAVVQTGNSAGGGTGPIIANTGNDSAGGNTGDFTISTGNSVSGNSGDILISPGSAGGIRGNVTIDCVDTTITGKLTVVGLIDPTQVLLTGPDKKFGATDAGGIYLAPFADQAAAIDVRAADDTTKIVSIDTNVPKVSVLAPLTVSTWNGVSAPPGFNRVMEITGGYAGNNTQGQTIDFTVNQDEVHFPITSIVSSMDSGAGAFFKIQTTENYVTTAPVDRLTINGNGHVVIPVDLSIQGGPLNMNGNLINNVADPVSPQDAATRAYVLANSGSGANTTLSNLGVTALNADLIPGADDTINLGSVADRFALAHVVSINSGGSPLSLQGTGITANFNAIHDVATPTLGQDAVNKTYADSIIGSAKSLFIYQPGGVAAGNTYATWADLYAALNSVSGLRTLAIDDSLTSPAVIPAGAFDLTDVNIVNGNVNALSQLSLDDGVVFTNLRSIQGALFITANNTITPVCTVPNNPDQNLVIGFGAFIVNAGTQVIWDIAAGATLSFLFHDVAIFEAGSIVNVNAGSRFSGTLLNTSAIEPNTITSTDPSATYEVAFDATSSASSTQTGFTGSINITLLDAAEFVHYNPATPSDWGITPPSEVADALDKLAAGNAGLWTEVGSTLEPTTPANRILLGGATDDTVSTLQVDGFINTTTGGITGKGLATAAGFIPATLYSQGDSLSADGTTQLALGNNSVALGSYFLKSRSTDGNTAAAVQVGDWLGTVSFFGDDGTGAFEGGASTNGIIAVVDDTVSAGTVPMALTFVTNAEAMRISSTGKVGIGTATPVDELDVTGNVNITGKLTVGGIIDPTQLLLTGADKKYGATDAGPIYLAPFADQAGAIQIRKADDTTNIISVDTTVAKVNMLAPVDMGSNQIHNLADPISAQDAANKTYVDSIVGGANTALSNLAATAVNVDIIPGVTDTVNLGSLALRFNVANVDSVSLGANALTITPETSQPITAQTQLLLHLDNNFQDFSGNNVTMSTALGTGSFSPAEFSNGLTSTTGGYPYVATYPAAFNFTNANMGIDFWLTTNGSYNPAGSYLATAGINTVSQDWALRADSTGAIFWDGPGPFNTAAGAIINDSQPHHYALMRVGSTFTLYIDGVTANTGTSAAAIPYNPTNNMSFAGLTGAGDNVNNFFGTIDEVRVTVGSAPYTADFPVPAAPYGSGNFINVGNTRIANYLNKVDQFTLSAGQVSSKSVVLSKVPAVPSNVIVICRGTVLAPTGVVYNLDFTVAGSTLTWNIGGSLMNSLVAGNVIAVSYQY